MENCEINAAIFDPAERGIVAHANEPIERDVSGAFLLRNFIPPPPQRVDSLSLANFPLLQDFRPIAGGCVREEFKFHPCFYDKRSSFFVPDRGFISAR